MTKLFPFAFIRKSCRSEQPCVMQSPIPNIADTEPNILPKEVTGK